QNDQGYRCLTELISRAYLEGQHQGVAYIKRSWLQQANTGLIVLSGGREGDVGQALLAEKTDLARERLAFWQQLFPDRFYLELQRTDREGDEDYLHAAVALAAETDCPVVATNDVRFLDRDEFEAHEVRV